MAVPRALFTGALYTGALFTGGLYQDTSITPVPGAAMCGTPGIAPTVLGTPSLSSCGGTVVSMIQVGNDLDIKLEGLASPSGTYRNTATVTYGIYNRSGLQLVAPTAMDPTGSNGNYQVILESSVIDALIAAGTMIVGDIYTIRWVATTVGLDGRWDVAYPLGYRGAEC